MSLLNVELYFSQLLFRNIFFKFVLDFEILDFIFEILGLFRKRAVTSRFLDLYGSCNVCGGGANILKDENGYISYKKLDLTVENLNKLLVIPCNQLKF